MQTAVNVILNSRCGTCVCTKALSPRNKINIALAPLTINSLDTFKVGNGSSVSVTQSAGSG